MYMCTKLIKNAFPDFKKIENLQIITNPMSADYEIIGGLQIISDFMS